MKKSAATLLSILALSLAAVPAGAFDDDHLEVPIAPPEVVIRPDQALIIAEPLPGGAIVMPPERITVFMKRFEFDLVPSGLEVYIDGTEYSEALRFWIDRAWVDTPPGFWSDGPHVVTAVVRDVSGGRHVETMAFDKIGIPPTTFPVPVDPHAVTNLFEDYQSFSNGLKWHRGLDLRTHAGTPVLAARGGPVVKIDHYGSGDSYWSVAVQDADGFVWQYHHMHPDSLRVQENDVVSQGDTLGVVIQWNYPVHNHLYNHLHLNVVRWLGGGPIPGPYVDGWEYHNPLAFLDIPAVADTVVPTFSEVLFAPNEGDSAFARDGNPGIPVLMGDVDLHSQMKDNRTTVPGIPGHPYSLGLYSLAWSVVPRSGDCFVGWVPKTVLGTFDRIPYGTAIATHDQTLLEVFRPSIKYLNSDNYGSQFDAEIQKFLYTVTNSKWGVIDAAQGFWNTDGVTPQGPLFPDGDYEVKLYAEDFHGNETVYTTQVDVSNGLNLAGICPSWINDLHGGGGGNDIIRLDFSGGESIRVPFGTLPVVFGPPAEGSATARVGAAEWPGWSFTSPSRGAVYQVRLRAGQFITVEYVPYLGDVILEIPAEVEVFPIVAGADGAPIPAGTGDAIRAAVSVTPVDLRLSTRLARNEWSGAAAVGSPHAPGSPDFRLVAADPLTIGTETLMLRTDPGGAAVSFDLSVSAAPIEPASSPVTALQVFPNPFIGKAHLRYETAGPGNVRLDILDVAGRRLRTVHDGRVDPGVTTFTWDGRDSHGRDLPAGVYFLHVLGPEDSGPRKIVKLR